jgi:hypothetical protein
MGGSSYSDDHYHSRTADRAARGVPTFDHTAKVKSGAVAAKVHDKLNPKGVTRESRDSDAHPLSVPIGVLFDVTGSMGGVPVTLQAKIPSLMSLLLRKGYIQDPQILFGAIGDYFADHAALQVGQFESGLEMDDDLTKLWLEGGGGGTAQESYQNAFYFFARHTVSDAWEKRGRKGYLFVIGDEQTYLQSKKDEIAAIFGDTVQHDISTKDLIAECQERYHVFFLTPGHTSYGHKFKSHWADLIGPQNVISLDEPDAVCETIGVAIGLVEGTTDLHTMGDDLASSGASAAVTTAVTTGLGELAKSTALAVAGSGSLPESLAKSDKSARV